MRLKLSKRGDYVVRSAICLAASYEADAPKKLRQVSLEMGVPRTFVSQIMGDLVQADIAISYFGTNGGYRLARRPENPANGIRSVHCTRPGRPPRRQ
jgi:DNA-binding IscR family transcriptional regulator